MTLAYLDWNRIIAMHFFNEKNAGKDIILFINEELINQLGKPYHVGFGEFVQELIEGPSFIDDTAKDICQKAYDTYKELKIRSFDYPPYIAYLALFICAATKYEDFDSNSYYPRLKKLVGDETNSNMSSCFAKIDQLWDHLQWWSQVRKGELLGRFRMIRRGKHAHVGLIYSQTVISESEINNLPTIFMAANLDPNDPPSVEFLKVILVKYGREILENRTRQLLENNSELSNKLIECTLSKLKEWDGVLENEISSSDEKIYQTYARICLNDEFGKFSSFVRFKLKDDEFNLYDQEFQFQLINKQEYINKNCSDAVFKCKQNSVTGWSTPLLLDDGKKSSHANATDFDWSKKYILKDQERRIQLVFRPADVKIFFKGLMEKLPHTWVEVQRLEFGCDFLLVCNLKNSAEMKEWGTASCDNFIEISQTGLPNGRSIFYGQNPQRSNSRFPELTLPSEKDISIKFKGGIKLYEAGNFYLHFAPPEIFLDGAHNGGIVMLEGRKLEPQGITELKWEIPEWAEVGRPLKVEARIDEISSEPRTLWLVMPDINKDYSSVPKIDQYGSIISQDQKPNQYSQGALVYGIEPSDIPLAPSLIASCSSSTVILIGSEVGQIALQTDQDFPIGWQPVWALMKEGRKKWRIHFCGNADDLKKNPTISDSRDNRRSISLWKKYVWHNNKRNKLPQNQMLRSLWKEYMDVAENV